MGWGAGGSVDGKGGWGGGGGDWCVITWRFCRATMRVKAPPSKREVAADAMRSMKLPRRARFGGGRSGGGALGPGRPGMRASQLEGEVGAGGGLAEP